MIALWAIAPLHHPLNRCAVTGGALRRVLVESLKEIAAREGVDNSYVSRMVNLTTLAPDIVAAILDDTLPSHITLFDLAVDPSALWDEQRALLRG